MKRNKRLQMTTNLADYKVLKMNTFDTLEKSPSEPNMHRRVSDKHCKIIPNGLLSDPNTIRQLAMKCDEKLILAMQTAKENASLRERIVGLKQELTDLQKLNGIHSHEEAPTWTDLLAKSGKLPRKDRVLLVQSMAGQLGMIARLPRTHFK